MIAICALRYTPKILNNFSIIAITSRLMGNYIPERRDKFKISTLGA